MDVKKVSRLGAIELVGIEVGGLVEGSTIRQLTLRDTAGHVVVISKGDYGTELTVQVKTSPPVVTRYVVDAKFCDMAIRSRRFKERGEADLRADELRRGGAEEAQVNAIEVPEDQADAEAAADHADIPF